jgi:hypothetical protein
VTLNIAFPFCDFFVRGDDFVIVKKGPIKLGNSIHEWRSDWRAEAGEKREKIAENWLKVAEF